MTILPALTERDDRRPRSWWPPMMAPSCEWLRAFGPGRKIQVPVQPAALIEFGGAVRAGQHVQIRSDGEFAVADTAQDGPLVPLIDRPLLGRVVCGFPMAFEAGIVTTAAAEFDGNHVGRARIVDAA